MTDAQIMAHVTMYILYYLNFRTPVNYLIIVIFFFFSLNHPSFQRLKKSTFFFVSAIHQLHHDIFFNIILCPWTKYRVVDRFVFRSTIVGRITEYDAIEYISISPIILNIRIVLNTLANIHCYYYYFFYSYEIVSSQSWEEISKYQYSNQIILGLYVPTYLLNCLLSLKFLINVNGNNLIKINITMLDTA